MGLLKLRNLPNIDFIAHRRLSFSFSGVMMVAVFLGILWKGLPYGVDFKGGALLEVHAEQAVSLGEARRDLQKIFEGITVQAFGGVDDFLVRFSKDLTGVDLKILQHKIKQASNGRLVLRRLESVGPKVSAELLSRGLYAIFLALLAMLGYIWIRFEWRFGIAAFLAILHDCVAVLGLYAVFRFEFTESAIVAILITASYSINDTVVVFDRVRENKGRYNRMPFKALLNLSVNETLSRTLLTSLTTLGALFVLYMFGGPVIADFSLPILIGLVFGTYSSICLAAPLLSLLANGESNTQALANQNKHKMSEKP